MTKKQLPPDADRYWPCACVKRDKQRNMSHIKCHHPTVKRCRVCKCEKPEGWDESQELKPE